MNELTIERREELTDVLAEQWADAMDIGDLIAFYIDAQLEYLNKLPMNEFIELAEENELID
jgi:hypothetical protein